jgi:DNA mismatch repair protein MutS
VARSGELIDLPQNTRRNLELTHTLRGETSPTLFSLLDVCHTGMGSRSSCAAGCWSPGASAPGARTPGGHRRLRGGLWQSLRQALKGASDVERITARTALRQVRPRELVGLGQTLARAQQLARTCSRARTSRAPLLQPWPPTCSRPKAAPSCCGRHAARAGGAGARRRRDRRRL